MKAECSRTHFNNHLLKMTFGVWYDMWWELRKEWRLQVRAECHHRYFTSYRLAYRQHYLAIYLESESETFVVFGFNQCVTMAKAYFCSFCTHSNVLSLCLHKLLKLLRDVPYLQTNLISFQFPCCCLRKTFMHSQTDSELAY